MRFLRAFPKYESIALQFDYWKDLSAYFTANWISIEDVVQVLDYFNGRINSLAIDVSNFDEEKFERYFKYLSSMKSLIISSSESSVDCLVQYLCLTPFNQLKQLNLLYKELNDEHLIHLTHKFKHLRNIRLQSRQNLDYGLKYFLTNTPSLETLGVVANYFDDESIDTLFNHHQATLISLELRRLAVPLEDTILSKYLKDFKIIRDLKLNHLAEQIL